MLTPIMPNRGKLAHAPWPTIKALALQGFSYSELGKQFGISEYTIAMHAIRQRWQISKRRAELRAQALHDGCAIPAPADTQKLARELLHGHLLLLKKLLAYYNSAPLAVIRKDQQKLVSSANTLAKISGYDGPKLAEGNLNVAFFDVQPEKLAKLARSESVKLLAPDSPSVEPTADSPRGDPPATLADNQICQIDDSEASG